MTLKNIRLKRFTSSEYASVYIRGVNVLWYKQIRYNKTKIVP